MSSEQLTSSEISPELKELNALGIPLNTAERAAQLESITGEGIVSMLDRVHRIVAPDELHEHNPQPTKLKDREGNVTGIFAGPEERGPIFEHAADRIRELFAGKAPNEDVAFLKRAGDIIAIATVLAHPYAEGNGRSARTLAQLVRYGLDVANAASIDDMTLLSANRPMEGFRVNGYLPKGEASEQSSKALIDVMAAVDLSLSESEEYIKKRQAVFALPYSD